MEYYLSLLFILFLIASEKRFYPGKIIIIILLGTCAVPNHLGFSLDTACPLMHAYP